MGFEGDLKTLPGEHLADADLTAKQFFAVKLTSSGIALAGDGDPAVGILQNKPFTGEQAGIAYLGATKALSGAAYARGVQLAVNAAGKLITAVAGKNVVAIALETAGGADEIVGILMRENGKV